MRKLRIAHLYPDLLNLYGDYGNVNCLQKRLQWRGIGADIISCPAGYAVDFENLDIVLLGGGSDREQELACKYLKSIKEDFKNYVENNGVVLAVCGGYQLLGNYYKTESSIIEGLGILDIYSKWYPKRLVQNVMLKSPLFKTPVVGFENHGGRTYIGNYTPFGKVVFGGGNTGASGYEGVIYKNVIGTYLHGPLLPKNPEVCDYLLEQALKKKYGNAVKLEALSDYLEYQANRSIQNRFISWNITLARSLDYRLKRKSSHAIIKTIS